MTPGGTFLSNHNHEPALRVTAIAAGGALGTIGRYEVAQGIVVAHGGFPWPTFLVNVIGSFVLGVIITLVTERWPPTRYVRPFAAIGFCGGFTTFSTFTVEAMRRAEHGNIGLAAVYVCTSLIGGVVAAGAGVIVSRGRRRGVRGHTARPIPDPDSLTTLGNDLPGNIAERGLRTSGSLTTDERTIS